jgi:putative resolvase
MLEFLLINKKKDLDNQIKAIQKYCKDNKIQYNHVVSEVASGLDLDRTHFSKLLDDILHYKVDTVIISHKDRLTRLSFSMLEHIFKQFNTKILIINKPTKYFDNEYFNDLLTLMHSFSTKFYSKRANNNLNV